MLRKKKKSKKDSVYVEIEKIFSRKNPKKNVALLIVNNAYFGSVTCEKCKYCII